MEKNNIKYLIFSGFLFITGAYCCLDSIWLNNIYVYNHFDVTGISKYMQILVSVVLFAIASIALIKAIKSRREGVNFEFNKIMSLACVILIILSIGTFIFVRSSEESVAKESNVLNQDYTDPMQNLKNYFEVLDNKDEYYNRKQEILKQVEKSSVLERYISMVIFNPNYSYYGESSPIRDEVEYYGIFLKTALAGIIGAAFYGLNLFSKDKGTSEYYEEEKSMQDDTTSDK